MVIEEYTMEEMAAEAGYTRPDLSVGLHDEGHLEFHKHSISVDGPMFEDANPGMELGKHQVFSLRRDGMKHAYLIDAVAFAELLTLALDSLAAKAKCNFYDHSK